ncbi:MAG: alpha/beta fold hydrolase [Omnitrophica WOR_2 bacterium]
MIRVESLLSARLFMVPQLARNRLYFISNLGGHLSLYAMNYGGSVPEPLLPPHIALQNPHLMDGFSYYVFPDINQILVMIDKDGDENYQPMLVPLEGGFPQVAFDNFFANYRAHLVDCFPDQNLVYISGESKTEQMNESFVANLKTGEVTKLGASIYGANPIAFSNDPHQAILADGYTMGDIVLYRQKPSSDQKEILYGTPLEARAPGQEIPLNGIFSSAATPGEKGLLLGCALFSDTYGLGYLDFNKPGEVKHVSIQGTVHTGTGEMDKLVHLDSNRYLVGYNIDGCSWIYEGRLDETALQMTLDHVLCGQGGLANGMLESIYYDKSGDRFALSYSTAISPTQIYTVEGKDRSQVCQHTNERVLGIPQEWLSPGEDASFTSFDGTRVSSRLYLPAEALGFEGPRPLVYYIHGGPQGQERPDFAWFSMPLIQYLTLNGFAVFVPNVRGSTGYGLSYTKQVDRDWGGQDRLDHVYATQHFLPQDKRLDVSRAAVVGRSYGGYMTLTLAGRHPELWSAAADMFGPYNLLTFVDRIPVTWKPYFYIALGHPETDRDFLVERSPSTYLDQIACPLLVIQGKHDPRVIEAESHDVVDHLRSQGKEVEYLVFENEGHDVLKYENRVTCYNTITEFFKKHLQP